ncbi:MAG: bamB, partial [Burkholderiales bacterium]|nr:bamB [Burkholderiales bacterium]
MAKRYLQGLANCLIPLLLISCATPGPNPIPVPAIPNPEKLSIVWSDSDLSSSPAYQFVPVIGDNAIFTADKNGNIFKIDRTDGTIINHFKLKRPLSSGTAVSSDSIFVTGKSGYLYSVNKATGKINWRAKLPTISVEAPQVSGHILLVKTNDAAMLAYDTDSGNLLWVYQKPTPNLTLRANNTFAVVDKEVAAVGEPGGRLVLLNITNGNPIWETYIAISEGATDLDKLIDVAMRPVLYEKTICVATFNGKLSCLDAISSNMIWSKKFSTNLGVLIDTQNVYAVDTTGVIYAFDKLTGASIWKNDALRYHTLSQP